MPKRILQGVVTSDKNEQTITVLVERRFKHPLLQKTVRKSKKYRAHDEHNKLQTKMNRNKRSSLSSHLSPIDQKNWSRNTTCEKVSEGNHCSLLF